MTNSSNFDYEYRPELLHEVREVAKEDFFHTLSIVETGGIEVGEYRVYEDPMGGYIQHIDYFLFCYPYISYATGKTYNYSIATYYGPNRLSNPPVKYYINIWACENLLERE